MPGESCAISQTLVESSAGKLHCHLATPAGPVSARLLIVHGYGEHARRYLHFMRWLAERGVASEAIDLRGHGRSPGRRGFVTRWDEYLDDLQAFLNRDRQDSQSNATSSTGVPPVSSPRDNTGETPVSQVPLFIMGHSHGGLIVAIAGQRGILQNSGVAGCILASPYLATRIVTPWYKRFFGKIADSFIPCLGVPTGLRPQWLTSDESMLRQDAVDPLISHVATPRWYFTTLGMQLRAIENAPAFTLPLLCMIGADDVVADPATAARFFRDAGSADKSHYVYPTCAHELFRETSREVVFNDVLRWMNARLPAPQ